ncbi:MAG: recombinase RecA [Eubacteriales bacterium]|nr:recombinase RecA [Clostridiales bacterium]MDD7301705.1 recombinase RecA [Eubacteriales bacterium]
MKGKSPSKPVPVHITDADEKKKAIEGAIGQIEKNFGKGAIMRMGEAPELEVSAISTGSLTLDLALGIGGVPRGRIVEIYGPESSGKTTVALHVVAETQKSGGEAAYIDVENALDPVYAKALGVDIDRLLVSQPSSGEQALDIAEALIRSGAIDVVVVDSVAALVTQQEIEGDMAASHVGMQARLMSQALKKLSSAVAKTNCVIIFINQLREKIGVMYGNPETTPGGRALKFYASVRIDIRRAEQLKEGNEIYGNHIKCKIVKNKVAPPFKTAEFDILYGKGIARSGEIVEIGIQLGIIQKSGSWFSYGDQRIAQGKENTRKYLEANPALMEEIADKIKSKRDDVEQMLAKDYGEDVEDDAEDSVDPDDEELDIRILDTDDSTEE